MGMGATQVGAAVGVGRSAVSNWESGVRRPDRATLARLDHLYSAGGALVDLAAALGTPGALDARTTWWHNFAASGGPAWAWARPAGGAEQIGLQIRWGPLGLHLHKPCDTRGLMVTAPASVDNPPLRVELDSPGWVDFGQGRPPRQLGLPVVVGPLRVRLAAADDHTVAIFSALLRPLLSRDDGTPKLLRGFLGRRADLVEDALSRAAPQHVTDLPASGPTVALRRQAWPGGRYRLLREARGLSQSFAAIRATAMMPTAPVSDDQIALLEAGGCPRVDHLASRLDVIYGADGHTVLEPIAATHTNARLSAVSFPQWWVGPVWITLRATTGDAAEAVTLRWPPWEKHIRVRPGTTVTARKAAGGWPDLEVCLPPGWTLTPGLGHFRGAVDVNQDWHPVDRRSADAIFNTYLPAYLQLFGKTKDELFALLRQHKRARADGLTPEEGGAG